MAATQVSTSRATPLETMLVPALRRWYCQQEQDDSCFSPLGCRPTWRSMLPLLAASAAAAKVRSSPMSAGASRPASQQAAAAWHTHLFQRATDACALLRWADHLSAGGHEATAGSQRVRHIIQQILVVCSLPSCGQVGWACAGGQAAGERRGWASLGGQFVVAPVQGDSRRTCEQGKSTHP